MKAGIKTKAVARSAKPLGPCVLHVRPRYQARASSRRPVFAGTIQAKLSPLAAAAAHVARPIFQGRSQLRSRAATCQAVADFGPCGQVSIKLPAVRGMAAAQVAVPVYGGNGRCVSRPASRAKVRFIRPVWSGNAQVAVGAAKMASKALVASPAYRGRVAALVRLRGHAMAAHNRPVYRGQAGVRAGVRMLPAISGRVEVQVSVALGTGRRLGGMARVGGRGRGR